MGNIVSLERSIIPACDVDFELFKKIVKGVEGVDKVKAVKLGFTLGYAEQGLPAAVKYAKDHGLKVIFDHQKGCTDIPDTGKQFMDAMSKAGVDAVILFPQSGPVAQYEWTKRAQERNLQVIVGFEMTHPRFLQGDFSNPKKGADYSAIFKNLVGRDLSGYIRHEAPKDTLELAAAMGVRDFVVPGNKPGMIAFYRVLLENQGITDFSFYAPGFLDQGGNVSDSAKQAGKSFHAIVGRGIYSTGNINAAAQELSRNL